MSFHVVILSARASNLAPCVRSILENEPDLPPERIVVVDDGARAEAEPVLPPLRWLAGAKPFVFARNANIGIAAAASGIVLLNDDACLATPRGFTLLTAETLARPAVGICSAGIAGAVGNPRQAPTGRAAFRVEYRTLAFVCVYIPRAALETLGPLDERFTGYGFEDNDYCARALAAGFQLGVYDGCVVDHSGALPSTFRTRPDLASIFEQNRRAYAGKWGRNA